MNLHLIEIKPLNQNLGGELKLNSPQISENHYTAIAIEDNGKFYYWAQGISIEISSREYESVITNPNLYYFSTALRLHCRLRTTQKNE